MSETKILPTWAEDLRKRYLRGESSMFILHGNVFDVILNDGKMLSLTEFLTDVLLKDSRENIIVYNLSSGARFPKKTENFSNWQEIAVETDKAKVLAMLERSIRLTDKTALILEYAEAIAPAGETSFQTDADRASIVTLHRWSFLPEIERGDNIIILISENIAELAPKIVSNPKVAVIEVPMPDFETRRQVASQTDSRLSAEDSNRYAEVTAGLKAVQIASILLPPPQAEEDLHDREAYILSLLGKGADAKERAHKLAALTSGMNRNEIKKLVAPDSQTVETQANPLERAKQEADKLIASRKREIIERECFGLVEFVTPEYGFEVVGGMEEVKKDLLVIADSIRKGTRSRVPMGILFTGPMGTGKTFVAETFAKECGLTTIKLKNFRSKWVGATEGNLEKILSVIKAIGQVIVIIDEGDRAFGNTDGDGDGGTSSRVIARIKEFMSDTSNRGRIMFLVMTNRPDKLDVDLKRAGRLDRKIPFLYSQTPEEVEMVAKALLRKNKIKTEVDLGKLREEFSTRLVGYSNADVEAVILMANDDAARESGDNASVEKEHFIRAASDYFPSRDIELLEYMELLAVFESSSRRFLPVKYAGMTAEELDLRLRDLRLRIGNRR
ncbi:MAG: ATP-binding protein [Acidobacteria bacterium]|jgi:SpoVK/Ycf46/Vps4 family AAA+-type ATPase|nr:ATP-binding protein [Acidobacteriota bacterium]MBA4122823.1 ATP-binding protein [Acidobacteriota bacterium]HEV8160409.1 AAA family ATPase [Pyrinomonadaceae bacterium]